MSSMASYLLYSNQIPDRRTILKGHFCLYAVPVVNIELIYAFVIAAVIVIELSIAAVNCQNCSAGVCCLNLLVYRIIQEYHRLICRDLVCHISEYIASIRRLNSAAQLSQ